MKSLAYKDLGRKNRWSEDEKALVANEAGKLMALNQTMSPGIALMFAQKNVLVTARHYNEIGLRYNPSVEIVRMAESARVSFLNEERTLRALEELEKKNSYTTVRDDGGVAANEYIALPIVVINPIQNDKIEIPAEMTTSTAPKDEPVIATPVTPVADPIVKLVQTIESGIDAVVKDYVASKIGECVQQYLASMSKTIESEVGVACNTMLSKLDAEIKTEVEAQFQKHLIAATPKPKSIPQMYRVMIIGLVGEQVTLIKREYGECLRINFVGVNEGTGPIKKMRDDCDFVIVMVKFVNHNTTEATKGHKGLIMITGGMSELQNSLLNLVCS